MDIRKLTYDITEEEAGRTVRAFLSERLGFSSHQMSRLKFREDGITVNGSKAYVSHILKEGDRLQLRLTQRHEPRDTEGARPPKIWLAPAPSLQNYPLQVLYEDADLLIVNKPAGIVCHPSPGHYMDTLANQAAEHLGGIGTQMDIRVTGRLDRETSGIVTLALNTETAAQIQKQRASGSLDKTYLALVRGIPGPAGTTGRIDAPLRREYPGSHRMVTAPDGKAAVTEYVVERVWQEGERKDIPPAASLDPGGEASAGTAVSLLRCRITHGRTHQIRVHMASIGYPLVGDPLYGVESDRDRGRRVSEQDRPTEAETVTDVQMCLHAWRLRLIQPFTGETIQAEAPAPAWAGL